MLSLRPILLLLLSLAFLLPSAHGARTRHRPSSRNAPSARRSLHKSRNKGAHEFQIRKGVRLKRHKLRGQRSIDAKRARQIQQALIRAHYLDGPPSGAWDGASKSAMKKYQADQGWQTHLVPDARALVKLGLGPDYSKAINAPGHAFGITAHQVPGTEVAGYADVSSSH